MRPHGKIAFPTSPVRSYGACGREDPFRGAMQHARRLLEVEQREPEAVDRAADRLLDPVVDQQPAVLGLQERRPDPDPQRVPPRALARLQHDLGRAPVDEIGRPRERDARVRDAEAGRRPVEEDPAAVDPLGQERRVLVFGIDDDPVPLDRREVLRRCEIDRRARPARRRCR